MISNLNILKNNYSEDDAETFRLPSNLVEKGNDIHPAFEVDLSKNLETEVTDNCGILNVLEEFSLTSSELNENNFVGENSEVSNSLENIPEKSGHDFDVLDIKNRNGTTESFEREHNLWIPSKRTQHVLTMKIPYCHFPVRDLLTFPEICEEEITNRLEQLATTLDEVETTVSLTHTHNAKQDEQSLLELVQKKAFRAAADLTAHLLMVYRLNFRKSDESTCHSPQSIQLWFTRLALLVKMQEFKLAEVEASPWRDCDTPDLYYQFYPDIYPGRSGSMIPFQMRLLLANLPSHCGRHLESLNKLFSILAIVKKVQQIVKSEVANQPEFGLMDYTSAKHLWDAREKCVLISIVNVAIKLEDFILAVEIVNSMIKNESTTAVKQTLYSVLGRIYLQFGDLISAEKFFLLAQPNASRSFNSEAQDFQIIVDLGLLAVAQNDFHRGYQYFEKASFIDPSSLMVMNNCAVCLFYLGHLREAIRLLKGATKNDPRHALQDSLVLNLCTMYELNSADGRYKKLELLNLARLFNCDLINVSSFRLV